MASSQNTSSPAGAACVSCGRPASVTVVVEDDQGQRSSQEFCFECAEKRQPPRSHAGRAALVAAAPWFLIRVGAVIALLALSADYLGIAGEQGFGWRQFAGGEVGTLVLVVGVLLRSGLMTLGGLVLIALSLGADLFRVGHWPGMGWRQRLALPLAALCVAVGFTWQRYRRSREAAGKPPKDQAPPDPPSQAPGGAVPTSSRGETLH